MAGNEYAIADIALWGWGISARYIFSERGLEDYPNVKRLVDEISARPGGTARTRPQEQLDGEGGVR